MRSATRPKVVYVMGAGHSGSTILGVTPGNCEGFFFAGELEWWLVMSGSSSFGGLECTRFWANVLGRVADAPELFGKEEREAVERSSSVLRIIKWRKRRRLRTRHRRVAEELYRSIAALAEASHMIDTSHFPLRARAAERRLFVRHGDLIADPEGVVRQILDRVDSSSPRSDMTTLKTGFPLRGNKLLWSEVVALEKRPIQPARGSRITKLLQLPWAPVLDALRPAVGSKSSA